MTGEGGGAVGILSGTDASVKAHVEEVRTTTRNSWRAPYGKYAGQAGGGVGRDRVDGAKDMLPGAGTGLSPLQRSILVPIKQN